MASARAPASGMAVPPHDASTLEVLDPLAEATGLRDPVPATAASAADPASSACALAPPASAAAAAPASSAVSAAAAAADGDSGPRGGGGAVTTTGWPLSGFNERTKVNVAEQHGTRTSVVWRFFAKFSPALDDGKNAKCTLMKDDGTECKAVYKHDNEANTGTGSMVRHLRRTKDASHKQAIKEFDAESKLSGAAKGARGAALGGAVKGPDHLFGRPTRKPMAEGQTERLHRKYVTWCVVNGMPWEALDNIGFKLIVAECDPAPAAATRDRVLREMYGAARAKMVEILGGVRGDNKIKGYDGPFCSLQLDLTFRAGVEYTALSAHLIRSGDKTPTRLSLGIRSCPGRHTKAELIPWIEEVTVDYFGEGVRPDQVFVSATVDPASAFADACTHLGVSTILCRGHRLKAAVMRALGLEGGDSNPKTATMKGLIGRCSTLLGLLSSTAVDKDGLRDQTTGKQEPVEDVLHYTGRGSVGAAQHSDPRKPFETSWSSPLSMLQKTTTLMAPIAGYLLLHPHLAHLGLTPEEWLIITEMCGVLDLFKYVSTAIEGGGDCFVGRSIFLCNTLLALLGDKTTMIIDCGVAGASPGHKSIGDLHATTSEFITVAIDELKRSKPHVPELEVEIVSMFLDPRYKSLDGDDSGGEDHAGRISVALAKLRGGLTDRQITSAPSPTPADAPPTTAGPTVGKREENEDPFAEYSRKRQKRAAAAAAVAAAACTVASRFDKEVMEYKFLPETSGRNFDLLSFWNDAGRPSLDEHGNIRALAKFPTLAMLARVYHTAETTTTCQPEGGLSAVAFSMSNLRRSMRRDLVDIMAFLKLNKGIIPEVCSYTQKLNQKVQSDGYDKAVIAQADGAGEKVVVVQ